MLYKEKNQAIHVNLASDFPFRWCMSPAIIVTYLNKTKWEYDGSIDLLSERDYVCKNIWHRAK